MGHYNTPINVIGVLEGRAERVIEERRAENFPNLSKRTYTPKKLSELQLGPMHGDPWQSHNQSSFIIIRQRMWNVARQKNFSCTGILNKINGLFLVRNCGGQESISFGIKRLKN